MNDKINKVVVQIITLMVISIGLLMLAFVISVIVLGLKKMWIG